MKILLIIALVLFLIALAFVGYGREKSWQLFFGNADLGKIDLANIKRTKKPHDALLCSTETCQSGAKIDDSLPTYSANAEELITMIDKAFQNSSLLYERVDDGSDPAYARYVTRSSLMRFPDTNQFFAIDNADGTSSLIAYASAQIGYSDAGANLKRLKSIIGNLPN
ncbi:DUF1499 domain-containing protein [Ahrensia marina]|uniref:DUF1499 domain-containing protein n=1 Tax=Ahrensia marina TaxID=1514904 RepID=A0A0M9GPW6_9HYPH|nr:DUF1499 domain-containing protein [Ahrensia marina]KPB02923.1 hypothetical protein SU32_01260 [Ahrensia marina]